MDKELKAKWVKELRSGLHQQAKGRLVDGSGALCCLGVLQVTMTGTKPTGDLWDYALNPCPVGLRTELDVDTQNELARLNDSGKSFAEIADYIERTL